MSPDDKGERIAVVETRMALLEANMNEIRENVKDIQRAITSVTTNVDGIKLRLGIYVAVATFLATGAMAILVKFL